MDPRDLEIAYLRAALAEKDAIAAYSASIQKVRNVAQGLLWAEVDAAVGLMMQRFEDRHAAALAFLYGGQQDHACQHGTTCVPMPEQVR